MTELAVRQPNSLDSKIRFAQALADASLLPSVYRRQPANVLLAMELGDALGIPHIQAITGIHVVEGRPSASGDLLVALIRRAGHRVRIEVDDDNLVATVTIIRSDDPDFPYVARWDMEKAKKAGLLFEDKPGHIKKDNWRQYPGQMLRNRAVSECARMAATDALYGVAYTPEELGADVDGAGNPYVEIPTDLDGGTERVPSREPRTKAQSDKMFTMLDEVGLTERDDVLVYISEVVERNITSTKDLTRGDMQPIYDHLQAVIDGEKMWDHQYQGFVTTAVEAEVVEDGPMFPEGVDETTGEVTTS